MIDVASRATNGVKIPSRKAARKEIMDRFHEQMAGLKARFTVSLTLIHLDISNFMGYILE